MNLADDVTKASFDESAKWNISGTTATCTAKINGSGYYVSGNEIKYIAKDKIATLAKISGLKSGTKINSDNSITGINYWYWFDENERLHGEFSVSDATAVGSKVTVDGDVSFRFDGSYWDDKTNKDIPNDYSSKIISGTAADNNIYVDAINSDGVSLGSGKGNDTLVISGGKKSYDKCRSRQ